MKNLKIVASVISLLLLLALVLTSCGIFEENETEAVSEATIESDTLPDSLKNVERGEIVPLQRDLLIIKESFVPSEKQGGYVSTANISATISGFDADYTYFATFVTITWTYNEISELYPDGIDKTYSTTIGLNADGSGSFHNQISFEGCRSIKLISVNYEYGGTATKK